jgi:LacI family transcriptional regulator
MFDVARRAGVALGTVSNVINQPHKVTEKTKIKVQAAIDELGFVRNSTAGSLAKGTSNTIGFVTIDLGNTFFLDMVRGAEEQAQALGKSLLLANSDVSLEKQDSYLTLFNEERVAGILLAPLPHSLDYAKWVRSHGRPIVVVNDAFEELDTCGVLVNNEHGGYLAAKHLIELGRKRIAFVGGPDSLTPIHERHVGAKRAVAETNGAVRLEYIPTNEVQTDDGRAIGAKISARSSDRTPDGIVAAADLLAVGIVQSLTANSSLSVPGDVAIIGYDNNRLAWDGTIPISTLSQPGREMGKVAAQLLLEEILSPDTHVHRRIILEPTLIARQSTIGN